MNKSLLFGGIALVVLALIMTPNDLANHNLLSSKDIVTVKLIGLPDCIDGNYRNDFLMLEYNNTKTILKTSCKYVSDFHVGQQVQMFHKDGTNKFVFPNENPGTELISDLLIGLIGLVISFIAIKRR